MTSSSPTDATTSPTAHLLDELALYGHRPFDDEADPRPLPDPTKLQGAIADIFDALVATLSDTPRTRQISRTKTKTHPRQLNDLPLFADHPIEAEAAPQADVSRSLGDNDDTIVQFPGGVRV